MRYETLARIQDGRFSLSRKLPAAVLDDIVKRAGTVESDVLFTGYRPARLRGEMRTFEVLPAPR